MPFFQNVFDTDFTGALVLGDRNLLLNFSIPANKNNRHDMVAYNVQPYNVSTNKTLTINYSFDAVHYSQLAIDVSTAAASTSAAKALEIVNALNANSTFTTFFTAFVTNGNSVRIQTVPQQRELVQRTYFANTGAAIPLGFNNKTGVKEIPTYFARHTVANASVFSDSVGLLIQLDGTVPSDLTIIRNSINNQSWTTANLQSDYQLFQGRSGIFNFQKITVDGSNRITQIIEYPAGAITGDFAKKITYIYSGSNSNPSQITEEPYTLTNGDLIVP